MNQVLIKTLLSGMKLPARIHSFLLDLLNADLKNCSYEICPASSVQAPNGVVCLEIKALKDGKPIRAFVVMG